MAIKTTDYLSRYNSIQRYTSRIAPTTARNALYRINYWLMWVKENSGKFKDYSPDDLVEYQRNASTEELYEVLDLVQSWILSIEGTHKSKKTKYNTIRGFFKANRAALPQDKFRINADREGVKGDLTPQHLKDLVLSSKTLYRAVFLCMFIGGFGQDEFVYWSDHGYDKLVEDLKKDPEYIRVDLPGRKGNKYERFYYTIIAGDALDALKEWLKERPKTMPLRDENGDFVRNDGGEKVYIKNTAIFNTQWGDPLSKKGIYTYWIRHMKELGFIESGDSPAHRTGRNPHELRDLFRSQWEKSPAKGSVAEFCMGHVVDQLEYNKAHRDEGWVRREYENALPLLQIMSSSIPFNLIDADEVTKLRKKVARLESERMDVKRSLQAELAEIYAEIERLKETEMRLTAEPENQHRVVESEDEMLQLLNEGWTLVQQLNGDKYLLKK